jgi:protoporphyrinogen oxidase
MNALKNLGLVEAAKCVGSYVWVRIKKPDDPQNNLEDFYASRFGWRLYRTFFKTYTEKVWGVPVKDLQADFGAQRVKSLSLFRAGWEAIKPKSIRRRQDKSKQVTSLIEEFHYPKYGPGMMWERCRDLVEEQGTPVEMETRVVGVKHDGGRAVSVVAQHDGATRELPADHVISSMPFPHLLRAMDPPVPEEVKQAADDLAFRDFLTVALVVPEEYSFPDNWIYIHAPEVKVGRIQNFGSWSPYLVKDGRTCLGLEYFVFEGDETWNSADEDLVEQAKRELQVLGLGDPSKVEAGYVVRMPKAYPVYDESYKANVLVLRKWLEANAPNVHPVGRNGMHKYNNQDHSMYTAMLTVENILGADNDIWDVNVEEEYHETGPSAPRAPSAPGAEGTGRDAPVIPRSAYSADHPLNAPRS